MSFRYIVAKLTLLCAASKGQEPKPYGPGACHHKQKGEGCSTCTGVWSCKWRVASLLKGILKNSVQYITDIDSTTRLQSITQERDLDEFLSTATLAGTQFTAGMSASLRCFTCTDFITERRNVKIISQSAGTKHNPYLLTDEEEKSTLRKHAENKQRLRVPRRPPWTKAMTTAELDRQEKDAFLKWRRGLAELQERDNFLLTPFERNIEVWRQLWRVLERSHLIVQIVDARNPLRFRCDDLESYVHDVEGPEGEAGTGKGKRKSLLLINKSDLLTAKQRYVTANFFGCPASRVLMFRIDVSGQTTSTHRVSSMPSSPPLTLLLCRRRGGML